MTFETIYIEDDIEEKQRKEFEGMVQDIDEETGLLTLEFTADNEMQVLKQSAVVCHLWTFSDRLLVMKECIM